MQEPGSSFISRFGRTLIVMMTLVVLGHAAAEAANIVTGSKEPSPKLESQIQKERANGKTWARVRIAASPGHSSAVKRRIVELGGSIEFEAAEIDYLRATVSIDAVDPICRWDDVDAIETAGFGPAKPPSPVSAPSTAQPMKGEGPPSIQAAEPASTIALAETKAYNVMLAMKAPQFIAKNTTYDGRGVTIGIVEGMPDLLSPELQRAKTLDGKDTRKVVTIRSLFEKWEYLPTPSNRLFIDTQVIHVSGLRFNIAGETYKAPRDGEFRFGLKSLSEPAYLAKKASWSTLPLYLDDNGHARQMGVLWDELSGEVWLDLKMDHDLSRSEPLHDYNVSGEVGTFGKDDPNTPWRESTGFIVLANPSTHDLRVDDYTLAHTTGTSMVAAGKGLIGSIDGVAPGAQLSVVVGGPIEGTLALMRDPLVDVVWNSTLVGGNLTYLLWDRMSRYYDKLLFHSPGDFGPVSASIFAHTPDSNVLEIGEYVSKESMGANLNTNVVGADYVDRSSDSGPAINGSLQPIFVTPVFQIAPATRTIHAKPLLDWMPSGYGPWAGTSSSAPAAAGAAALLISAAKQRHIPFDAARLRQALINSARHLEGIDVTRQGNGLIDIERAWETLQKRNAPVTNITSVGFVRSSALEYASEAFGTAGVFEREGWTVGTRQIRTLTLHRAHDNNPSYVFDLQITGNDGTFSISKQAVELPTLGSVAIAIKIQPKKPGLHSAILSLIDPQSGLIQHQEMLSITAAIPLTQRNRFGAELTGVVEPLKHISWFVRVPAGTAELKVEARDLADPLYIQINGPISTEHTFHESAIGNWIGIVPRPREGVWEISIDRPFWDPDGKIHPTPLSPVGVRLRASVVSMSITAPNKERPTTISVKNDMSDLDNLSWHASVATVTDEELRPIGRELSQGMVEVKIRPGTDAFAVRLKRGVQPVSHIALSVFDCSNERTGCQRVDAWPGSLDYSDGIVIPNPSAGRWVVFGRAASSEKVLPETTVEVIQGLPELGTIQSSGSIKTLHTGEARKITLIPSHTPTHSDSDNHVVLLTVDDSEAEMKQSDFKKLHPEWSHFFFGPKRFYIGSDVLPARVLESK